jgi:hypothetical protein
MPTLASHDTCHHHALEPRLVLQIDDIEVHTGGFLCNIDQVRHRLMVNHHAYLCRIPCCSKILFILLVIREISFITNQ